MSVALIDETISEDICIFFIFKFYDNSSLYTDSADMKILPFNASQHDESNKLSFVLLRSLDAEILQFECFLTEMLFFSIL